MRRILLIQANQDERSVIERHLTEAGCLVIPASSGREGLKLARRLRPDLVLLDAALPDMADTALCKALKREPETARISVVVLSDKSSELDRVVAFELGVDDYCVKPISQREVTLRVDAILRRVKPMPDAIPLEMFGRLRVDREAHRVWVDQREVTLTALEFNLLMALYDRRGRTRNRSALLREVWHAELDPATRTIDQHVKRLRERLGPAGEYIETVRREGYRFTKDLEGSGLPRAPRGG